MKKAFSSPVPIELLGKIIYILGLVSLDNVNNNNNKSTDRI